MKSRKPARLVGQDPQYGLLAQTIDALDEPAFVKDRQHRILLVNDAYCRFTLRKREELMGKTSRELFPPGQAERLWASCEAVFRSGRAKTVAEPITSAGGMICDLALKQSLMTDGQGNKLVLGVFRDVSEQRWFQERLGEALAFQRTLIESAPVGIICFKAGGAVVSANAATAEILGGTVAEVMRVNFRRLKSWKTSGLDDLAREVLATGREVRRDVALTTTFGKSLWLHVRFTTFTHDHQPYLLLLISDITQRIVAAQEAAQARHFLEKIINGVADPVFVNDRRHRYVLANDAARRFAGNHSGDIIGKTAHDFLPKETADQIRAANETLFAQAHGGSSEMVLKDPAGQVRHFISRVSYYRDDTGDEFLVGVARDVTDIKAVATTLRTSEERYRVLFNSGNAAVFVHRPFNERAIPGRFLEVNDTACRRLGYSRQELLRMSPLDIRAPEVAARLPADLASFLATGTGYWESVHVTKTGERIPVEVHSRRFELNGEPLMISEAYDLTKQKLAEHALRQSEHRYRSLFANMMQGLIYCRVLFKEGRAYDWIYLEANDAFLKIAGLETVVGMKITDRFPDFAQTDPELLERYGRVALTGRPDRFEIYIRASHSWFSISVYSPQPEHIVAVLDVITERKAREDQLRKLSQAVEQSSVSVVITDDRGRIEYVNPKFTAVSGYLPEEALGRNPSFLKSGRNGDQVYRDLWSTIASGREWHGEFCNRKKNGELYWETAAIAPIVAGDGHITHYIAIKEDITAQKKLEEELRQAQKMEAFGRLAAGVAHDFNNMMTSILCAAELLNADQPLSAAQQDAANEIIHAVKRATSLTRQLLTFSRRQAIQLKVLEMNEVVENLGKMLRRLIGEHILLTTRYGAGRTLVFADPGMMEQVLVNLAVNARDAMLKGGRLMIMTGVVEIAQSIRERRPGTFVRLTVRDSGCGISRENLPHIFEPFFTTKEIGKGTGLGLATVFGIVKQHNGWIEVESEVNQGTTFQIFLPQYQGPMAGVSSVPASPPRPGHETILLVEDEAAVRALARQLLVKNGYRVIEAPSGAQALELWRQHRSEIELLFTDMVMPGNLSGLELSQRLLEEKPELKVVFASGYSDEMLDEGSLLRAARNFIEKPYASDTLLRAIRSAFES